MFIVKRCGLPGCSNCFTWMPGVLAYVLAEDAEGLDAHRYFYCSVECALEMRRLLGRGNTAAPVKTYIVPREG